MELVSGLANREMGQIPISIGTSLAIESVLGILPEHETDKPAIKDADQLWINIRTLYRNIMGAVDKDVRNLLAPEQIVEAVINEMQAIEVAISHQTKGLVSVVFYHCHFRSLTRKYPHAQHKTPNTPLQKEAFSMEQLTMKGVIDSQPSHDFRQFDIEFDGEQCRTFIITHYPIDLLNRYKFKTLTLLESHTGTLKPPSRWYTKLQDGKGLYNIPFDRMTLQLFGDGVLFTAANIKIRRFVQTVAEKYKWSSITTKDYIVKSIKDEHDPVLESYILKLY